jgi:hypothetical protein
MKSNNAFQPVVGIAAALMSGVVFMLGVYVPAKLAPAPGDLQTIAIAAKRTPVAIEPSRIEVVGARVARTAAAAHVSEAAATKT